MALTPDEVRAIAELARLDLDASALERAGAQLTQILDFVAALDRLDLEGCEPASFAPDKAPLRADTPNGRRLDHDAALAGAPEAEDGFFLVPPVVENVDP